MIGRILLTLTTLFAIASADATPMTLDDSEYEHSLQQASKQSGNRKQEESPIFGVDNPRMVPPVGCKRRSHRYQIGRKYALAGKPCYHHRIVIGPVINPDAM